MIDEKKLIYWIKSHCNPYGKPTLDYDTSIKIMDFIENLHPKSGEWRLAEDPPKDDNYILLSFANFSTPLVGRYEEDEEGGAYYIGDDDEPCTVSDVFVDAWMPLPDPYRMDVAKKQTNADRIRGMTDEELLDIILCPYDAAGSPESIMPCARDGIQELVAPDDCHKCMMEWLQKEVEDKEDD